MLRWIYRALVLLHPAAFRRRFGDEILLTYEEAERDQAAGMLRDAFRSLARQWFWRSGSWRTAVALGGAYLQVAGGLMVTTRQQPETGLVLSADAQVAPAVADFLQLILWTVVSLALLLVFITLWVRRFTRRMAGR